MKQSWDALIAAHAPPEQRTRILENRFYQALSTALAGSQEYIALETLGQLRQTGRWDLIILDTPPTAHALDFLDAPNRILDFLDNDAARWLLTPALKVLNRGGGIALRTLSRITGAETLQELATFLLAVSGMNEGFRERARAVRALLSSPETAFALVTSAAPERREEAASFQRTLEESGMALAAVVVNRVHARPSANARKGAEGLSAPLRGKMLRTLEEAEALAARDADGIAALRALGPRTALVAVPQFPGALHDLGALWRAGAYLLGEAALR